MADEKQVWNANTTDKELWRGTPDHYSPRVFVTEGGGIGMDVGGLVIVKPLREWHKLAVAASKRGAPAEGESPQEQKVTIDDDGRVTIHKSTVLREPELEGPDVAAPDAAGLRKVVAKMRDDLKHRIETSAELIAQSERHYSKRHAALLALADEWYALWESQHDTADGYAYEKYRDCARELRAILEGGD